MQTVWHVNHFHPINPFKLLVSDLLKLRYKVISRQLVIFFSQISYQIWQWVNSLWPSDAIWQHRSGSTLVHLMAWCHTAPRRYVNQRWLIISEDIYPWYQFQNYLFKSTPASPRVQWVNHLSFYLCLYGINCHFIHMAAWTILHMVFVDGRD